MNEIDKIKNRISESPGKEQWDFCGFKCSISSEELRDDLRKIVSDTEKWDREIIDSNKTEYFTESGGEFARYTVDLSKSNPPHVIKVGGGTVDLSIQPHDGLVVIPKAIVDKWRKEGRNFKEEIRKIDDAESELYQQSMDKKFEDDYREANKPAIDRFYGRLKKTYGRKILRAWFVIFLFIVIVILVRIVFYFWKKRKK